MVAALHLMYPRLAWGRYELWLLEACLQGWMVGIEKQKCNTL